MPQSQTAGSPTDVRGVAGAEPSGPHSGSPATPAAALIQPHYLGSKDVGRAEALYRSALSKTDLDYSTQLLFTSLLANPEHESAFAAVLSKIQAYAAARKKMAVRATDLPGPSPADAFVRSLASYCAAPAAEPALTCAVEAQRAGLLKYAATLGTRSLQHLEKGEGTLRASLLLRLAQLLEADGVAEQAVAAARAGVRLFPEDPAFRDLEKTLLARHRAGDADPASAEAFRQHLKAAEKQQAPHKPGEHPARVEESEHRYKQTHAAEDFREFIRALREASPQRREAALPSLREGLERFGDREARWLIREIDIERRWSELRVHNQVLAENPMNPDLLKEHEALRQEALGEQIEHLYEVVSALPHTPERHRREWELAGKLFDAARHEEAIKQAQAVKRRAEHRLEAWVIMAKSFVRLGSTPEAAECFQSILAELAANPHGSLDRVLDAKYAYAEFLVAQAEKNADVVLARQARKLCADVLIEDIDYRDARALSSRADKLLR